MSQSHPSISPSAAPTSFNGTLAGLISPAAPIIVIKHRWRDMGLLMAYGVHLYGILLGLTGLALVDWAFSDYGFIFSDIAWEFEHAIQRGELLILIGALALTAILLELAIVYFAWILMPWGASPEPWRQSMSRGLTRLLQLTPFYAFSIVLWFFFIHFIENASIEWTDYVDPNPIWSGFSWETEQLLQALAWAAYCFTQVTVTLWALSIHRDRPHWAARCPWPAECEGCGYQLMGVHADQSCPECGLPVGISIKAPRNEPDTTGVLAKMLQATFHPYRFGKKLKLYQPSRDYRKALWIGSLTWLLTVPIGYLITITAFSVWEQELVLDIEDLLDDYGDFAMITLTTAGLTVASAIIFGLFISSLHGAIARLFIKRNILYPAAQAFAYQSPYFALVALGVYSIATAISLVYEHFYSHASYPYPLWIDFLPLAIPGYLLIMLIGYFILQGRLLRGARYGNE